FRPHPQLACGTYRESGDDVAARALSAKGNVAICGKSFHPACQPVASGGPHADPQRARGILIQPVPIDHVTAQSGGIAGIMQITSNVPRSRSMRFKPLLVATQKRPARSSYV